MQVWGDTSRIHALGGSFILFVEVYVAKHAFVLYSWTCLILFNQVYDMFLKFYKKWYMYNFRQIMCTS